MPGRLVYQVATSLDGFIADENGGYDWIVMDPDIDFGALFARFDALVMGRGTYEATGSSGPGFGKKDVYVVSTTLDPKQHKKVTVISQDVATKIADLKQQSGKDIWLFGGGKLFRSLLEAGLVERVELAIIPVLLGSGVPVLPGLDRVASLKLDEVKKYPKSGTMMLCYDVVRAKR